MVRTGRMGKNDPLLTCNGSPHVQRNMSDELMFFYSTFFHNDVFRRLIDLELFFIGVAITLILQHGLARGLPQGPVLANRCAQRGGRSFD